MMNDIEDFERCAPALLDPLSRDYIWSGTGSQKTLVENKEAYNRIWIKKRVLRGIGNYSLEVTVLGQKIDLPIGIAPSAGHSVFHPEGERGTARGASSMGAIMILNSLSLTSLEDIAASVPAGAVKWMQTYIYSKRDLVIDIVRRAEKAGYSALVVTVDEPYEYEIRCNSRSRFFEKEVVHGFPNIRAAVEDIIINSSDTFDDIAWLVNITTLPVVVKGIMT
ncbi:peroxisomal, partial [Nephila pilipes]